MKLTVLLAFIIMGLPVCGLRPLRALRCFTLNVPKPGTIKRPFFLMDMARIANSLSNKSLETLVDTPVSMDSLSCVTKLFFVLTAVGFQGLFLVAAFLAGRFVALLSIFFGALFFIFFGVCFFSLPSLYPLFIDIKVC